jgi:hypothetical protein
MPVIKLSQQSGRSKCAKCFFSLEYFAASNGLCCIAASHIESGAAAYENKDIKAVMIFS